MLAFTNKIKSIRAYIPEKIKILDDGFLEEEIPENFLGINADLTTELW